MFGPANLTETAEAGFSPSGVQKVFGINYNESALVRASPTHYVVPNAPPILIVQGVNERWNSTTTSRRRATRPSLSWSRTWGTCSCRLVRSHYADVGASNGRALDYLIIGTALLFFGVAVILGSNVAAYFLLSDVGNTVFTDLGAAISACGCVIAAYSFLVMPARS